DGPGQGAVEVEQDGPGHPPTVTPVLSSLSWSCLSWARRPVSSSQPRTTPVTDQKAAAPARDATRKRQIRVAGAVTASGLPGGAANPTATTKAVSATAAGRARASEIPRNRSQRSPRHPAHVATSDHASITR